MSVDLFTGLINGLLPEPHAGLLNGILFGAKATLDPALKNSLIETGTLHIIALSGMNISILVSLVDLLLLRFLRRPIANIATGSIIIGFIWLVGPSPSVIRAGIMGTLSLIAVSLGRQYWPLFIWVLAVSIMLVLRPLWIADTSFQLSVMATFGIILFGTKKSGSPKPAQARSNTGIFGSELARMVYDDLRVTLSAQLFTVPIIMFQFHRISLVSPLTNVLIGWLMAPIMVGGMAAAACALVWRPLGQPAAWVVWVLIEYVITVIHLTAKLPFSNIQW